MLYYWLLSVSLVMHAALPTHMLGMIASVPIREDAAPHLLEHPRTPVVQTRIPVKVHTLSLTIKRSGRFLASD